MAKKRLILTRRRKTEVLDEEPDIITSDTQVDTTLPDITILPENTTKIPETNEIKVELKTILPEIDIPNSILNNTSNHEIDNSDTTLCKFDKVPEKLDISLNSVEVLPVGISNFNDSIRKLMMDRNDVFKPYIEEPIEENVKDEPSILPNQKIQDRNDKVKNSSRTMVPTSRRNNPVSKNRSL